jgi:hypothetical protein
VLRRKRVIRGLGTLESPNYSIRSPPSHCNMTRKRQVSAENTSPYSIGRFRIRAKTFHKPVEINMSQLQKIIP